MRVIDECVVYTANYGTKLLDCALIGACVVIRSNTVYIITFWIKKAAYVKLWTLCSMVTNVNGS